MCECYHRYLSDPRAELRPQVIAGRLARADPTLEIAIIEAGQDVSLVIL